MSRLERWLINPTESGLLSALEEACRHVSWWRSLDPSVPGSVSSHESVPADRAAWQRFLAELAPRPEGARVWAIARYRSFMEGEPTPPHYLWLAWFSDRLARRHYRLVCDCLPEERHWFYLREGAVAPGGGSREPPNTNPDGWPFCALVYPGRLLRRILEPTSSPSSPLAICGCGACGALDALAWMGPCCGPCDDWAAEHGAPPPSRCRLVSHAGRTLALAFAPDGSSLASLGDDGGVRLWDLDSGALRWQVRHPRPASQGGLAISPDGQVLASCASTGVVIVDMATGQPLRSAPQQENRCAAFAPDGQKLYVGRMQGLDVWSRAASGAWHRQASATGNVSALTCTRDGRTLLVRLADEVRLLDAARPNLGGSGRRQARPPALPLTLAPNACADLAVSSDSAFLVAVDRGGLRGWDLPSFSQRPLRMPNARPAALALHPSGRYLAWSAPRFEYDLVYAPDRMEWLGFWDLAEQRCCAILLASWDDPLSVLAFAPDGETLAAGSERGVIYLLPWRRLLEA